jgi:hypothetical protein
MRYGAMQTGRYLANFQRKFNLQSRNVSILMIAGFSEILAVANYTASQLRGREIL